MKTRRLKKIINYKLKIRDYTLSRLLILMLVVSSAVDILGQNRKLDSLLSLLKTDKEDTNKVKHLHMVANEYMNIGEYNTALQYSREELTVSTVILSQTEKTLSNPIYKAAQKGIAGSYFNIAYNYMRQDNYPEALKNFFASLKMFEEIKDKKGIASSYNNIGEIYRFQGNYPEALNNYFASLKIFEEINKKSGVAGSYSNIGIIYNEQGNYTEALKNYLAALKIDEELKDKQGISIDYNNIGNIYYTQGNYPEALKNHLASLKIKEEMGDKRGIATSYNNLGSIYTTQGNYPEAFKNHFASLKIKEEIGDKRGIAESVLNLGNVYTKENKTKEAETYLNKALTLSKEIGSKDGMRDSYANLTYLDSTMGNYKAAFEHHKLYILYRDSLNNEETKNKSLQASMQYEFDKKEIATKAQQDKLDAINEHEKKKQQITIYAVAGVLIIVAMFSFFLYRRFKITHQQKAIIEQQKVLVDDAYKSLHHKNKEVMDSINYAKRIQTALITNEKYIEKSLNRLIQGN